ncbi:MAG TPA: NAD(P)-dependent alcohol dehydrogenase [Kiritimatiellia bacterium]|nr:NAD(P)-dependent alcohol dehydrogenase [Kiritimatiellia bacterium]
MKHRTRETMNAVTCRRYGPPEVLHLTEAPIPTPGKGEIRVRVRAVAITSADARIRGMNLPRGFGILGRLIFGVTGPRQPILGAAFAGTIEQAGPNTRKYRVGDDVFGINGVRMGAYAEYLCLSENAALAPKPHALSFEAAAALPFGGTTALDYWRRASVKAGEKVLIIGAAGSVGTAMVQLARLAGARVTAVCSGNNATLMQSLGAERVIDYTREDVLRRQDRYDIIADVVGRAPWAPYMNALNPGGRLLLLSADLPALLLAPWRSYRNKRNIITGPATERAEDIETLGRLAVEGALDPVLERVVMLDQIPGVHHDIDTRHKRGNVVAVTARKER